MSGPDRKRRRVLTRDERVMWSSFTKTIEPLRDGAMPAGDDDSEPEDDAAPSPQHTPKSAPRSVPQPVAQKYAPPLVPLDRRMKKRVASGREGIDARLDLHGLTQSEAHAELAHFFRAAVSRGARLVIVITGKSGVLRRQVPLWLALPEFRTIVIGFETAHVTHGGEGALYVRLRRER